MSLYIDLSEFLEHPVTTGIQRIAGEMCRYLPPQAAIPVRVHEGGLVAFPPALIQTIGRHFRDASPAGAAHIRRVGAGGNGSPVELSPDDVVLVPEVFDNAERLAFFRAMREEEWSRVRFIVYDLLPITHPEYFMAEGVLSIYGYYQLIRRASACGFISEDTRDVYYKRLKRTSARGGPVLRLGCDSLGERPTRPQLNRRLTFSVLGTIEPRKNHALILQAFEPLLGRIDGLTLEFIGKMGWVDSEFARKVEALAADTRSGLRFYPAPADGAIRNHIERTRATIYVSAAEGYGLPPMESLWVGTPVIASAQVPSVKDIGRGGVHIIDPLTSENLRKAVIALLDDAYANTLTEQTLQLDLPTWRSFTEEVLRWCECDVLPRTTADAASRPDCLGGR